MKSLAQIYKDNRIAEKKQIREFEQNGTWHSSLCNCRGCKAICEYRELSWYKKTKARWSYRRNNAI